MLAFKMVYALSLLSIGLATLEKASHALLINPRLDYVPAKASTGQVTSQFVALPKAFDAPYLSAINSTVFEWWWFEAVAEDLKSSLTVIFFTTSGQAFPLSGNTNKQTTSVFISALLPNGSVVYESLPATGAIFASGGPFGQSASTNFVGTGTTFSGSKDLRQYRVDIDALHTVGIEGTLWLTSKAPAHYGCTKDLRPGQSTEIFPHIGWSNALASADSVGTVRVGDQVLNFKNGLGYHDHNWGDQPFTSLLKSWYWGHADLGPYTLVWFDGITPDGKEHVSAYLAKDGEILLGSCSPGSVKVRPKGANAQYPPTPGKGSKFEYLHVTMMLDDGTELVAKVVPESLNINARPLYSRWIGKAMGGIKGEKEYQGHTAFEQFTVF